MRPEIGNSCEWPASSRGHKIAELALAGDARVSKVDLDDSLRAAAFEHIRTLKLAYGTIPAAKLAEGFEFQGDRVPLVNPRRGIFRPRAMRHLLSIKTVFPK